MQLETMYGKCPKEVISIIRVSLVKNLGQNLNIERIIIGERGVGLYFYGNEILTNEYAMCAISEFSKHAVLVPSTPISIIFNGKNMPQANRIKMVLEFLVKANVLSK
jgi:transcription-repair coupling factor (superfamily II helicase)